MVRPCDAAGLPNPGVGGSQHRTAPAIDRYAKAKRTEGIDLASMSVRVVVLAVALGAALASDGAHAAASDDETEESDDIPLKGDLRCVCLTCLFCSCILFPD